jgi:Xaa-Pro aminopeptidase
MSQVTRLQAAMVEEGVDLAVVGPSANLRWALGYDALAVDRLTALLVSPGAAVMILPDFDADEFVAHTGFEAVAPWTDRRGPDAAVADAVARLGLASTSLRSLVDDELPFQFFTRLRSRIGGQPGLLSELLGPIRQVKSEDEQARMGRAGELSRMGSTSRSMLPSRA